MRAIILVFFLLLAGCGANAAPGVDPCTGVNPSSVAHATDEEWIRTGHWLKNPTLSEAEACAAGQAEATRLAEQDTQPTAVEASNPTPAKRSLTDGQIDRMITFSTIIGRGAGCGFTVDKQSRTLVSWLAQNVSDPAARAAYFETASLAADRAAAQQRSGATGDGCLDVSAGLSDAVLR